MIDPESISPLQYHIRINRLFNDDYENGFYPKDTEFKLKISNPIRYTEVIFKNKKNNHELFKKRFEIGDVDDFKKIYEEIKDEYSKNKTLYLIDKIKYLIKQKRLNI